MGLITDPGIKILLATGCNQEIKKLKTKKSNVARLESSCREQCPSYLGVARCTQKAWSHFCWELLASLRLPVE